MPSVDAVVTGAGGFIGGHLVGSLLGQGKTVRGVDVKPLDEWSQLHPDAQIQGDVSLLEDARAAMDGAQWSTTSPPTWAAWASSRTTRRCA